MGLSGAQTLGRKGNIAALVERGGHPMENYDPHEEYALIGAKLVGERQAEPTWAFWRLFDKKSKRHSFGGILDHLIICL